MLRDIAPFCDPNIIAMRLNVVEQLLQAWRKLCVADCALVKPNRHHLWRASMAFFEERIDRCPDGLEKTLRHAWHRAVCEMRIVVLN